MKRHEPDKINNLSTCKKDETCDLGDNDQSNVIRLNLEKSASVTNEPGKYFVLPAGGMHFAVPELNFHVNHFKEDRTEVDKKRISKSSDSLPDMESYKNFQKGFKLPYGLELTAGPGQKKESPVGAVKKKAPQPSETLLASAAMIKSYFMPSQEKESNDADTETVKNKMIGLWHNMKYGWSSNLKTKFSKETPIFLLGKIYHKAFKEQQLYGETGFICSNVEDFKRDFSSLSWFTYRRKFPPLPESNLTTDCGWGCMIRSGQMMMFTGLRRHFLPSDWSFEENKNDTRFEIYKRLMKLFCDDPSPQCPFSLHNLILAGHKMKKKAGSWYGPSCVAYMFKDAVEDGAKEISSLNRLSVYVAQDGAVYVQDVLDLCSTNKCICGSSSENKAISNGSKSNFPLECWASENDQKSASSLSYRSSSAESGTSFHLDSCSELIGVEDEFNHRSTLAPSEVKNFSLDAFVDSNRVKYDNSHHNAFGDALASRLQEPPSEKNRANDETICSRCFGWKSCIIFIPVRLGGTTVNPIYYNCIYSLFLHDLCIGIIGGRPKHSLYFVGFQDDSLIHLDPHLSQDAISLEEVDYPLSTYHCYSPRKIPISKMDPSATIAFYCHTRSQFYRLLEEAPMIATAKDGNLDSPIFEFIDGRSEDVNGWFNRSLNEETSKMHLTSFDSAKCDSGSDFHDSVSSFEEAEELVFED